MNSWLYLPAEDFARSDDIDFTRACVHFWQDDTGVCRGGLHDAATAFRHHPVQVIVPMEMCSWLLTEPWPNKRRPGLQALAFAVEEQLADDLDALHIAVGPMDAQRRYPLWVTHKQRFSRVLDQLQALGLDIASVRVDADLLPREPACAARCHGRWLVGGAQDLRLALSDQDYDTVKAGLPADLIELPGERLNTLLSASGGEAINLLQGPFRPAAKALPWRSVCCCVGLTLAIALGFTHARSSYLETQAARLYALSEERFNILYPGQTSRLDLATQLRGLQQRGAAPADGHMVRLAHLVEQVIGASSVDVQRLEWREHGGWALTITASSFAELERLRERGEQSALPINVGNARQHGNRVQALLTLEDIL